MSTPQVNDTDDQDVRKSAKLMKGLYAVEGSKFRPSLLSCTSISGGNVQTLLTAPKELAWHMMYGDYVYDHREVFELSDGGKINIDYRGDFFNPKSKVKER